jgi:hypothetical protein
MSDAAREWLGRHAHDVPAVLQQRMERAAGDATGADVQDELVAAAIGCLQVALERCDERAAALHLLAADALATHACAYAANDPAALDSLAIAVSPARMSAIISRPGA